MTQQKEEHPDDLLSVQEAAQILSKNAGREIPQEYVRKLTSPRYKKLIAYPLDGRTNRYKRSELEQIVIGDKPGRKKRGES